MPENKEIVTSVESGIRNIESGKQENLMVDVEARTHVPENVKTWLQKIEEDPAQITVNDSTGAPALQPSSPQNPKVTLPTTKTKFMSGFKKTINDAGRWLSVFVLRLIKIKKGKVNFLDD